MVENRCLKIVLIRHGKPMIDDLEKITGSQLAEWVQRYNHAPIDPSCHPPLPLLTTVSSIRCIVTSPLRRSVESAKVLAPELNHHVLFEAREAELPTPRFVKIKMSARTWCALSRLAWFIGWSAQTESLAQANVRAGIVVQKLEALSRQEGSILLLGHGIMNSLIAQRLRAQGWKSLQVSGNGYWKFSEYTLYDQ
ncbi:histidine phosphatase family protein [Nodosilinea sp. LEGE 07298]|uniref:histidine phosphatase family protein n=1 Tax=Nodosilinea sp. LEGE 07298 TaxID=2777970 RepID=UPI00187EE111|nr:histidine phosphatase family protein [Nodosilinea sp. LEGE 07298]MBE9108592.1 histidine phosphatase family protein [Nodosilinea sp. LEGE 07298]